MIINARDKGRSTPVLNDATFPYMKYVFFSNELEPKF